MRYQPIDEFSLRHLFSSEEAEKILKLQYVGPVLSSDRKMESSPDCLIVDRRKKNLRIVRAEFKYVPNAKEEFARNGKFDIAIVWDLPASIHKEILQQELLEQNGCYEIVVLNEYKFFHDLRAYIPNIEDFRGLEYLEKIIKIVKPHSLFAAYIAAKLYPDIFDIHKLVDFLSKRFAQVMKSLPRGRSNAVSNLLQTKQPLIKHVVSSYYQWNNDLMDPASACERIAEVLKLVPFIKEVPSEDEINSLKISLG
jgi:hypothetical protein